MNSCSAIKNWSLEKEVLCISHKCETEKNLENVILTFQLAEQVFQDYKKEHIFSMILNL